MKNIKFSEELNNKVENIVENTKVSAEFVQALKEAFLMFPVKTDMRFKQSSKGELVISVTVVYSSGMTQHFEGAGDADLISAIHLGMAKIINGLHDYKAEEHEVETAKEGESLMMELFKQYMNSTMRGYIEADWYSNSGERYRCVRFSSTFNGNVKFCMKATDEVNSLIREACKPEWMKKTEAEQQVTGQNEVA
ncbi:hypothetical protein AB9N12_03380 [Bacteroides sp. AN502(2024)]|uniref:hypothetical protein n=1 Tax=Bacteroides sp. AN502(2024) TaxID=3160599 RepID=UPI0035111C34